MNPRHRRDPPAAAPLPDADGPRLGGLLAGTGLLTPEGYQPIERLRRGDLVATLLGHGPMFAPITWIGRRHVAHKAALVRIRRNAVADRMPNRDVVLAADHALYLEGSLYRARQLVNGATLLWDLPSATQSVWAIELDRHEVVMADGLAVETLLSGARAAFAEVTTPRLQLVGAPAAIR